MQKFGRAMFRLDGALLIGENGRLRVTIDRPTGRIRQLTNLVTGQDLLADGVRLELRLASRRSTLVTIEAEGRP
jgi:hypothetical protein